MKKKQYWFTLVELFATAIILGILAGVGIWTLSTRNAEKYKAEICINYIYGELSSFIHAASSSKILDETTNINTYNVDIDKTQKAIKLSYNTNSPYRTHKLNEIENCHNDPKYTVKFDPDFEKASLLPWLKSLGNTPGISIDDQKFIWEIKFDFCQPATSANQKCEDLAKINLDARTGLLTKSFCQLYNTDDPNTTDKDEWKTCAQRSL